ncbi:multidrug efflux SMR transporter, partial [Anaerovibrio sp. RM50]|uniref:DMT family transporter n=1 Tax=Anaerovibrio sp. RM50 TaxID=1200557 RepID=UPI000559D583
MSWVYLLLAGLSEMGWAVWLKYTEGFSRLLPSIITITLMAASFALLSLALKELPISTAYAIWTGIGTIGTFVFGYMILH